MTTVYEYWRSKEVRCRVFALCCTGWLRDHYLIEAQRIAEGLDAMPIDLASEPVVLGAI